jgi:hypothetical protein
VRNLSIAKQATSEENARVLDHGTPNWLRCASAYAMADYPEEALVLLTLQFDVDSEAAACDMLAKQGTDALEVLMRLSISLLSRRADWAQAIGTRALRSFREGVERLVSHPDRHLMLDQGAHGQMARFGYGDPLGPVGERLLPACRSALSYRGQVPVVLASLESSLSRLADYIARRASAPWGTIEVGAYLSLVKEFATLDTSTAEGLLNPGKGVMVNTQKLGEELKSIEVQVVRQLLDLPAGTAPQPVAVHSP